MRRTCAGSTKRAQRNGDETCRSPHAPTVGRIATTDLSRPDLLPGARLTVEVFTTYHLTVQNTVVLLMSDTACSVIGQTLKAGGTPKSQVSTPDAGGPLT
jgi:hypothetical protein